MLNNEALRNQTITRRAFMLASGGCGLFGLLFGRMFYMQVIRSDEYRLMSDQNRINLVMLSPARGKILDCNGIILAQNQASFKVMLDSHLSDNYKEDLSKLFELLQINEDGQKSISARVRKYGLQAPLAIMEDISWQQLALIEENIIYMKGIYIEVGSARLYSPLPSDVALLRSEGLRTPETLGSSPRETKEPEESNAVAMSHLLGYVGILSEKERGLLDQSNVGNFNMGKSGVEKFYEERLQGTFGIKKVEVNAHGGHVRELSKQASIPGQDLKLNINAELQVKIYNMLPPSGGSVVVMDLEDGKVISLVSGPGFDPNEFTGGVSHEYWNKVQKDPFKPMMNKVTQGTYPPGSVFKMLTCLAGLENGIDPNMKVHCAGHGASALGGNHFRCHYKPGHGTIDMRAALHHSCNAYMYQIARMIGGEKILDLARKCGLGTKTGLDLPSELSGFVPSPSWKMRRFKSQWALADSLNIAIGQGALLVTPIQLANLAAIIATGGKKFIPRIVGSEDLSQAEIDPKHLEYLRVCMWDTVNTEGATAYRSRVMDPSWMMAGKTGTSQVKNKRGDEDLSSGSVPWAQRNHALFIGYAPADRPRYAVSVVVDHGGGGGSAAAPIARDVVIELSKL